MSLASCVSWPIWMEAVPVAATAGLDATSASSLVTLRLGIWPSAVTTKWALVRFFIASDDCLTKAAASAPPLDVPVSGLDEQPDRVIAAAAVSASAAPNRSLIHSRFLVASTRAVRGALVESHIKRSARTPADTSGDARRAPT